MFSQPPEWIRAWIFAAVLCMSAGTSLSCAGQWKQIFLDDYKACVVSNSGEVTCWGGQIFFYEDGADAAAQEGVEYWLGPTPQDKFSQIACGRFHCCGIRKDKTLQCWGCEGNIESDMLPWWGGVSDGNTDVDLGQCDPPGGEFEFIDARDWLSCGIRVGGQVECWGDEEYLNVEPDGEFVAVSVGPYHGGFQVVCAIEAHSSNVACWIGCGKDGNGSSERTLSLYEPPNVVDLEVDGYWHLRIWGIDHEGAAWQWAPGISDDSSMVEEVLEGTYQSIETDWAGECYLRDSGEVECNGPSESAIGGAPDTLFDQISVGADFACGITKDREHVECWGCGHYADHSTTYHWYSPWCQPPFEEEQWEPPLW